MVTNFTRADQVGTKEFTDLVFFVLNEIKSTTAQCVKVATPLLCRYIFPTCDPAYEVPVYQPICRRDCEIVRDFYCPEPWQEMLRYLSLIPFGAVIDQPNCDPLKDANAGAAPMCISTLDGGMLYGVA